MYLIALGVLLIFYMAIFFLMKHMKNTKIWNIVFASLIFICYATLSITVYRDVGANDWNFQNTLPTANISPFMFSIVPIVLILPKKIKKYFLTLISLLFIGMLLSTVYNCIYNTVINYKFHFHFLLDYIAHFVLSLWGVYLVKSKQIELSKKDCIIGFCIMLCVVSGMLITNLILDTAFFGLSLNGKHNIYNVVLVSNSYLSAIIYYCGVVVIMLLGLVFQKLINKKNKKKL